jgi:hypothetical protein
MNWFEVVFMYSEDKPWFNVECKLARQNYRKLRRKYKKNRTEKNKEELNNSEKYYKRTHFTDIFNN